MIDFADAARSLPLVAILRGIRPAEADAIGEELVGAGFGMIEVPLNSSEPLISIERLASRLGSEVIVGAGTVLDAADVARVQSAGGRLIISPNTDRNVIMEAASRGLISIPGYFTVSEAFEALAAGASALKLFPADGVAPSMIKAQRAVLPKNASLYVVGGVTPCTMADWVRAGADGFGIGSALFAPGKSASDVAAAARSFVSAWREARQTVSMPPRVGGDG